MKFAIYKLEFTAPVHFGEGSLSDAGKTFCADTLFSALYLEALKTEEEAELLHKAQDGAILLSDAFPYIGEEYYVPKPMLYVEPKEMGNSVQKKMFKKLKFIPVTALRSYLSGEISAPAWDMDDLGNESSQVMAAVHGEEVTRPYVVGSYRFAKGCGLYCILGYREDADRRLVEDLLTNLSYAGIGGKRSGGKGRFCLKRGKRSERLEQMLQNRSGEYSMLLSTALPRDEELEDALEGASYLLQKRSGFILSETYAEEQRKKKDLFTMQAGSCFRNRFEGDIYDVSEGGKHPVYRYARAMFAGM